MPIGTVDERQHTHSIMRGVWSSNWVGRAGTLKDRTRATTLSSSMKGWPQQDQFLVKSKETKSLNYLYGCGFL